MTIEKLIMRKTILGFLSILLFCCCSKDNTVDTPDIPDTNDKGVEVNFNSSVATSIIVTTSTRAPISDAIPVGHNVGVYGIPAMMNNLASYTMSGRINEENFQQYLFNAKYEVSSVSGTKSNLKQINMPKFPSNQSGMDGLAFYAYYPYTSSPVYEESKGYKIPITLNATDMSQTYDYLYTGQISSGCKRSYRSSMSKWNKRKRTRKIIPFKH